MNSMDIDNFLASHSYAETTKSTYRRIFLQLLVERDDLADLSASGLVKLVQSQGWGNSQQCVAVAACRKFLRWQYGARHPARAARIKVIPTPPQPRLTKEKVNTLLASFDDSDKGKRDRCLVLVALDTALRASELCNLELGNVDLEGGKMFALIKGGQWSWRAFSGWTAESVAAWVDVRSPAMGVSTLFVSFQKQRAGESLTREGLQSIMKAWARKVGFHISPHMFRRSYASQSTLAGAPKNVVKMGGGWKSDKMVDHYIGDLSVESTRPYLPVDHLF